MAVSGAFEREYLINFNMGCIETYRIHTVVIQLLLINFNMGCIETRKQK